MRSSGARAKRALSAVSLATMAAALCAQTEAAQWQYDPRVVFTGTYDDNYRLDGPPLGKVDVHGGSLEASLQVQRTTPTTNLLFIPRLWSSYFPGRTEENANDQFAYFGASHTGQTSNEGVTVEYRRQTLLKENLPDAIIGGELGQPSRGTDVGTLFANAHQTLWLIDPHAQLDLTPRQRLDFNGEYDAATYSQEARQDYVPYKNTLASVGYEFQASLRSTVTVRALGSIFRPDLGADSTTYGGELEWASRVTETSRYYLRAGVNHTQFDASPAFNTPARGNNTVSAGAGVNWTFQVTTVFLDAMRSIAPSSGGYAVDQDQLRLRLEHRVTPRLADLFSVTGIRNNSLGNESTAQSDRRYIAATAGLEWRVRREWTVTGTYTYTWQQYVTLDSTGRSNAVNISLIYEPHRPENGRAVTIGY
jgi:hypothetical protein